MDDGVKIASKQSDYSRLGAMILHLFGQKVSEKLILKISKEIYV